MKVTTTGYVSEFQVENYLKYAHKTGEIQLINIGSKTLYKIYLNCVINSKSKGLVVNHKSSLDSLLASYGQETLEYVNGKQVRRLKLDIEQVNYKDLQDQLIGDFCFYYPKINQIIIVDNTHYNEHKPNLISTKNIQRKLYKLKQRSFLYKALCKEIMGINSYYISVLWNENKSSDLLETIEQWHLKNIQLRSLYKKIKQKGEDVNSVLTQIHVKTNINLTNLYFDITEGIYR